MTKAALDPASLRASAAEASPPDGLTMPLSGLWWDARGDWNKAHECAQAQSDWAGDWVHAYLHRKEGDASNAAYWYRRAKRPVATVSLDQEWIEIAAALLAG